MIYLFNESESYLNIMTTLHLTFYLDLFYASHKGLYMYAVMFFICTMLSKILLQGLIEILIAFFRTFYLESSQKGGRGKESQSWQ